MLEAKFILGHLSTEVGRRLTQVLHPRLLFGIGMAVCFMLSNDTTSNMAYDCSCEHGQKVPNSVLILPTIMPGLRGRDRAIWLRKLELVGSRVKRLDSQ